MIYPGSNRAPTMASYSTKPYAIMEFDSLLATALSSQYMDNQGRSPDQTAGRATSSVPQRSYSDSQMIDSPHVINTVVMVHTPNTEITNGSPVNTSFHELSYPSGVKLGLNPTFNHRQPMLSSNHPSYPTSAVGSVSSFTSFLNTHGDIHRLSPYSTNGSSTTSTITSGGPVPMGDNIMRPGPNLIKPIAFKPVHASPERSPLGYTNRRVTGSDDHVNGSHDMARPHAMKLGTSMLGIRGSPDSQNNKSNLGAFNSMAKLHPHPNIGTRLTPNSHHGDITPHHHHHHPPPSHPHPPPSVNSSHSSSHHNSSSSSHHNSYSNIHPGSQHNMSANSSHLSGADETSFSNEFPRPSDRPDSVPSLNASRVSSHAVEGMLQTPSPSDSGVGELEAMLREKDAEINTLREVMDRNERAIFQVYEERRHVWLQDTQELRDDYERKLKVQSRKSYKTEQVLSLQVYKLQQEQKTLQEEKSKIASERDALRQQAEENQAEISELKSRLAALTGTGVLTKSQSMENQAVVGASNTTLSDSSLQEELALKNKELITLKSQLQAYQTDMEKKNKEVADKVRDVSSKTDQLKSLKEELLRLKDPPVLLEASSQTHAPSEVTTLENMKPSMLGERDRTINGLQDELLEIRAQVTSMKEEHEKEREQWLDEKNKVVRYQKQLQLNYVQMQRKNTTLETEVQQLTLELENRDMKLIALNGEESVC